MTMHQIEVSLPAIEILGNGERAPAEWTLICDASF
jgi:hypothetical protein